MKRLSTTLLFLSFLCTCVSAQSAFNSTLRDRINYGGGLNNDLNDVWGYVAPNGMEYALVGLYNRLSIVSLADPDNIVEVATVPGTNSRWRDIKTYGQYAYVVAEKGTDGIVAVDLSGLPNSVSHTVYNTNNLPSGDLKRAHNIFIDETTGLAYLAGAKDQNGSVNGGGMIIYDVATTPGVPTFVAMAPAVYAHDVYVQDNLMYASEINVGKLTIYDVSDPLNITTVGSTVTPRSFTHNAWASADGNYVFTTDEKRNAPTTAYDISDIDNQGIEMLGEYRPARSLNTNTIPHNVHVKDMYLVISHYTDGVEIVDVTDPSNMVSVAHYDTWTGANGGFNGTWGTYPFLPSGLVLASDISNGLFVFDVNYQRAARLAGTVTDGATGNVLNNVKVTIADAAGSTGGTTATGRYKTGSASSGMTSVTYSLSGYQDQTMMVNLERGVERIQDVVLQPVVLPVTLSAFSAEASGKDAVQLSWSTEAEANSDYFSVERSRDGRTFTPVGRVAAAGNSAATAAYGFTDTGLAAGSYFYRLRQVDQDGSFALSEVREVALAGGADLTVYPNPVDDRLRLSADVSGNVRVYRADGVLVLEQKAAGREIAVGNLPAGQYWLLVGGERISFVKR